MQEVDRDGSDVGGAIALAASLIPRGRPGRLIVLSDGESNGTPVPAAAYDAASRGLPIDFRIFSRGDLADIAVESLSPPGVVDEREPFQFAAEVRTDRTVETEAVLFRDGRELARTKRTFQPGVTQLTFRDMIDRPGVARYRLQLAAQGDRVPENNVGEGAVRVQAPATTLLVNASGGPDNLSRALVGGQASRRDDHAVGHAAGSGRSAGLSRGDPRRTCRQEPSVRPCWRHWGTSPRILAAACC